MAIHIDRAEALKNTIVYTYPTGNLDIICSAGAPFKVDGLETAIDSHRNAPALRKAGKKSSGDDMLRSMRRARANLRRLALANDFDYFVTLTLDPAKINRYDAAAIMHAVNAWLSNMVQRRGLRYVLVPERHKDGAFHFHGFFAGQELEVVDSGTVKLPGVKQPKRPASEAQRQLWLEESCAQPVYNLPQWTLGFSTAMRLHGEYSHAVAYICKYVGKQDGERPMGRWYYSGGALQKPQKEYFDMDYRDLVDQFSTEVVELEIPGNRIAVIHTNV